MAYFLNKPGQINSFDDLGTGLLAYEALLLIDQPYFSSWSKEFFFNTEGLTEEELEQLCNSNWTHLCKAFEIYMEKEKFHESYFDIHVDLILKGDKGEYFGFFIALISVILIKKPYQWRQSLGEVSDSECYKYLKELEENLSSPEQEDSQAKGGRMESHSEAVNETIPLLNMISELEKQVKETTKKADEYKHNFIIKREENEEIKKLLELRSFELERSHQRVENLESMQNEFFKAQSIMEENSKLQSLLSKAELKAINLEGDNNELRNKLVAVQEEANRLRVLESKAAMEENLKQRFDVMVERVEALNLELRKKDLDIDGLKYQVEILKRSKESLEKVGRELKLENSRLEKGLVTLNEELQIKETDVNSLDKIIRNLKDKFEVRSFHDNAFKQPGNTTQTLGKEAITRLPAFDGVRNNEQKDGSNRIYPEPRN